MQSRVERTRSAFFLPTRGVPGQCHTVIFRSLSAAALIAGVSLAAKPAPALADPPFSSTADTVFDIIRADDPSTFVCLTDEGRTTRQMWDKRIDGERDHDVFLFRAWFSEGPPVDIILNPEFATVDAARQEAERYTRPLGQLPLVFRHGIRQLGIHKGDEGFHGGPGKVFFYQDMVDRRISQDHLEESLLHESVHATLDRTYARSDMWVAAQESDGGFVTRYAAEFPEGEDLAESALFAFALLEHPGRIPPVDSQDIARVMPARINVIAEILATPPENTAAPDLPEACQ